MNVDFYNINKYIRLSLTERQLHLCLEEPCLVLVEGATVNGENRGILAVFLETTLPFGNIIHCCHACNNARCSNPRHMYWGTAQENTADSIRAGTHPTKMAWVHKGRKSPSKKAVIRKVICPHCLLEGGANIMRRYHFDNCKRKVA